MVITPTASPRLRPKERPARMYGGASFVFGLRMVVRRNRDRDARSVSVSPRVNCSASFLRDRGYRRDGLRKAGGVLSGSRCRESKKANRLLATP
jgi:hypothetical protein